MNCLRCGLPALAVLLAVLAALAPAQQQKLSDDALTVAKSANAFACDLYRKLREKDGNLFYSPYSISSALAMTYGGARGKTAEEMANTLHFTLEPKRLHPAYGELVKYLNATGEKRPYQLSVANALWGQKGFTFLPEFLKLTEDNYDAKLTEVDFVNDREAARKTINNWVEKKTNDKIKDLIPEGALNEMTRLVLTNAIYFKSAWSHKFLKENTKPADFTRAAGDKVKVPMMHKNEKLTYLKGDGFQAVDIPYEQHALSMMVLLPDKADGIGQLETKLSAANVEQWRTKMTRHQVDLKLPKFKFTSEFNLSKTLAEMGMPTAFTSKKADFSGMSSQADLYIQQVLHKAYVDVHEEGTEAAAATAVIVGVTSLPPPLPKATFHADRPFVFLIRENRTGSILFVGRVMDPTK